MPSDLLKKHCAPCEGGTKPLPPDVVMKLHTEVPDWQLAPDGKMLSREFNFKNFVQAVDFVRAVADIAEMEDHHPNIHIYFNRVVLELFTHAIKGLSENDFIVAAKIDAMPLL